MANTFAQVTGNLTRDPELRYTQSGVAVCNLSVAVNERRFDKAEQQYVDELAGFFDVTVWQDQAVHAVESLSKGDRVIVVGQLRQETYEKDGETRRKTMIRAESVAPDLRFCSVKIEHGASRQGPSLPAEPF